MSPREEPWILERHEVLPADPERVWRALTDPDELARWWCSHAETLIRPGGRYVFGGPHAFHGAPVSASARTGTTAKTPGNFEILDLTEGSCFTYRWWLGRAETQVSYELSGVLEATELRVRQTARDLPFPSWPLARRKRSVEIPDWWCVFLPALRSYLEKGKADLRLDFTRVRDASAVHLRADFSTFPWVVWQKLTDPKQLERWWATEAEVELSPGGIYRLGLEGFGSKKILEVEDERRLLHDWCWSEREENERHQPDRKQALVEWTVVETDEDTSVAVRELEPADSDATREWSLIYWASTLLRLKQMSERGMSPRDHERPH